MTVNVVLTNLPSELLDKERLTHIRFSIDLRFLL